jgi:DNA invertase Pin-like site-specific DNA recombinase
VRVTTAYSYVRMSSDTQLRGDSLRRQTEDTERFARENGLVLDKEFRLADLGVSAFSGENIKTGELGRFLLAVKAGKVQVGSVLIVESLDRLSLQKARPSIRIFLDLLDAGISIATLIDKKIAVQLEGEIQEAPRRSQE